MLALQSGGPKFKSLVPETLGVGVCTCNPSVRVSDGQIPGACWPASLALIVSSRSTERPCLQ